MRVNELEVSNGGTGMRVNELEVSNGERRVRVVDIKYLFLLFGLVVITMPAQAQMPELVYVSGLELYTCDIFSNGRCIGKQYDSGSVSVTVNGTTVSATYALPTDTAAKLAGTLASKINSAVPGVTASVSSTATTNGTISIVPNSWSNFNVTTSFGGSGDFTACVTDSGAVFPKYVVLSVIYAPPGAQSFVDYANTTNTGTTSSWSKSFSSTTTITTSVGVSVPIVGSFSGRFSTLFSQTGESDGSIAVTKTSSSDIRVPGPADSMLGIDHDFDVIYVWLNPEADFYTNGGSAGSWSYRFDERDTSEMDVIPLYVSQLNNPSTITDPNIITRLAKTWDTSGQGGLTNADLQAIAQRDPFYNLGTTPPASVDATRFDVASGQTFPYVPPPQGGQPITTTLTETFQTTSTQGKSATDQYSVTFFRTGSIGFGSWFGANIAVTNTLNWVNKWSQQTSQTTSQSSTFSITGPPFGYTGRTNVQLYKDNVYGTFLPNFQ